MILKYLVIYILFRVCVAGAELSLLSGSGLQQGHRELHQKPRGQKEGRQRDGPLLHQKGMQQH